MNFPQIPRRYVHAQLLAQLLAQSRASRWFSLVRECLLVHVGTGVPGQGGYSVARGDVERPIQPALAAGVHAVLHIDLHIKYADLSLPSWREHCCGGGEDASTPYAVVLEPLSWVLPAQPDWAGIHDESSGTNTTLGGGSCRTVRPAK